MEKVIEYINQEIKLTPYDTVVIAVSGGPDSIALLHLVASLRKNTSFGLVCAHVNHNVRSESKYEKEFVREFCNKENIIFESMDIIEYGDDNFHNEARNKRYNFFEDITLRYKAKYLFTAHHADDLIETVLMRIVRGSTFKGYGGFSKELYLKNYTVIRPFFEVTKDEIILYNKNNKLKYMQDPSNTKEIYTRNRYRLNIVPFFKKEDPNVHEKFIKFNQVLTEYSDFFDRLVKEIIDSIYTQDTLIVSKFRTLDPLIQKKIIFYILEHIYQDDLMLINDKHVDLILKLALSDKPNSYIYLPNEIKVVRQYEYINFTANIDENLGYEVSLSDCVTLPNGKRIEFVLSDDADTSNNCTRLNSEDILFPLNVRTVKQGDKIAVKGLKGHKKVNKIFTDCKVPTTLREVWPIVVDSEDNIIWIPGLKKSKFDKQINEKYDIIIKYN